MNTKAIFRIEHPVHMNGMWYSRDGKENKIIDKLCPYGIAKDFPMPVNLELHRKDGRIWNSAGKSIQNMNEWFAPQDALNLLNNGFKLFKMEVSLFQELENEVLFCREGIIRQEEIPLETVWEINNSKNYTSH